MKSSPFGTEKGVTHSLGMRARDVPLGFPHPDLISCQSMLFLTSAVKQSMLNPYLISY